MARYLSERFRCGARVSTTGAIHATDGHPRTTGPQVLRKTVRGMFLEAAGAPRRRAMPPKLSNSSSATPSPVRRVRVIALSQIDRITELPGVGAASAVTLDPASASTSARRRADLAGSERIPHKQRCGERIGVLRAAPGRDRLAAVKPQVRRMVAQQRPRIRFRNEFGVIPPLGFQSDVNPVAQSLRHTHRQPDAVEIILDPRLPYASGAGQVGPNLIGIRLVPARGDVLGVRASGPGSPDVQRAPGPSGAEAQFGTPARCESDVAVQPDKRVRGDGPAQGLATQGQFV